MHFSTNPTTYTQFDGADYIAGTNKLVIDAGYGVTVTGSDVIFDQLTGNCASPGTINITSNGRNETITTNNQGQIN